MKLFGAGTTIFYKKFNIFLPMKKFLALIYRKAEADRLAALQRMDELKRREEEAKRRQRYLSKYIPISQVLQSAISI